MRIFISRKKGLWHEKVDYDTKKLDLDKKNLRGGEKNQNSQQTEKISVTTRNPAIPELCDQIIVSATSSNHNILLHVFLLFPFPDDLKHYSWIVIKICQHTWWDHYRILNKFCRWVKHTNNVSKEII